MSKTVSNIIYNAVYQIIVLITPVITMPYVARCLGGENIGINAYVNSIPILLSPFIMFGLTQYGVKTIAQTQREKLPNVFISLWVMQGVAGLAIIALYILAIIFFLDYKLYFLLEIPFLVGYMLDISWFYIGRGEIKKVVFRNTLIKFAILSAVFLFVHNQHDLWKYLLINSVTYLANVVFWIDLSGELGKLPRITAAHFKKEYLHDALLILAPTIAVQFYISFDQTLVKWLSGPTQLAYYSQSQSILRALLSAIGSISTILMPKMAELSTDNFKGSHSKVKVLVDVSLRYTVIVSVVIMMLIFVNAEQFVVWFWGIDFSNMTPVLMIGSLIVIFVSIGGVFANQFALSQGLYREFAIPYFAGAVVSVFGNCITVPRYGAIGAAIVIVLTEFVVCFLRVYLVRKRLLVGRLLGGQTRVIICGVIVSIVGKTFPQFVNAVFLNMLIKSGLVTALLVVLLTLMGDPTITRIVLFAKKKLLHL